MKQLEQVWAVIWKIVLFLLVWAFLYAPPLLLAIKGFLAGKTDTPMGRLYLEGAGAISILIAAWVVVRFVDRRPFSTLGFARANILRDAAIGLAIGLLMMGTSVVVLWLAGWAVPQAVKEISLGTLTIVGIAMLFNTLTQEVLVRGYAQQTIQTEFGKLAGVVVSAVIFMLLHFGALKGAPLASFNLFAAGILLAIAYVVTNNLWLPIALHFAWNFLQGPVLGLTVSGQSVDAGWRFLKLQGPAIFTGGAFGMEGGLIATVATVLGIATLLILRRTLFVRNERRNYALS